MNHQVVDEDIFVDMMMVDDVGLYPIFVGDDHNPYGESRSLPHLQT